jgi:SAM-dependent MidA family methyltransferase
VAGEPVDRFLERALYGPDGFFTKGGGAGRRADFLTSPEVGPLFGAVVARAVAGAPVVVEVGAGRGALARAARAGGYEGRWICVERSPALRAEAAAAGFEVAEDIPADGVVVANELLDNLPFRLAERTADGWAEVLVPDSLGSPVDVDLDAPVGARIPLQERAAAWVAEARRHGPVLVFDYADTTASLAGRPWLDWVRTYRGHARGGHPFEGPGSQDVTCEVAVDQLPPPVSDRSQAEWLRAWGIDDLVEEGRRVWAERAHLGDLEAIKARSRVTEADALTDPTGLGAFRVLEWDPT